jgi:hypothetical protein
MKKFLTLIAVAAVMTAGLANNALAYFEEGHLVRVVWQDNGTQESVTDLGAWSTLSGSAANTVVGPALNTLGTTYDHLNVAYFVIDSDPYAAPKYLSGGVTAPSTVDNMDGLSPALLNISSYYGLAGTQTVTGQNNTVGAYIENMNYGGALNGSFNGYYLTGNGEANLAVLTGGGYADLVMYSFADSFSPNVGVALMTIRTLADGATLLNAGAASPVPVPGSVLLFGSGLLGLFGIRRKNA